MFKKNQILLIFVAITFIAACGNQKRATETKLPGVVESSIHNIKTTEISDQIFDADWTTTNISDGILHRYHQFDSLFDSRQSITVIEVDLDKEIKIEIPYVTEGFIKTSEAATNDKASAAINGSYFDTKTGGSTVFFKNKNRTINETKDKFSHFRENAGFAIDTSGKVSIIKRPSAGWQSLDIETILTSGPLLIQRAKKAEQLNKKFNTNRHPRTAIGVTADNHLIATVVDGRNAEAQGMSIEELSTLMQTLGCIDAMNLDGGGSSTAWVKGLGVVNYPSDNKKFDHNGERGVATVITFTSKK